MPRLFKILELLTTEFLCSFTNLLDQLLGFFAGATTLFKLMKSGGKDSEFLFVEASEDCQIRHLKAPLFVDVCIIHDMTK